VSSETHDVVNQPPPLVGYDSFAADRVLVEAVDRSSRPTPTRPS
jgi:putative acyl-CoA dehydrogenase